MANAHDFRYKKLFSHPKMVEELLTSFVKDEFISQLDFSTLEQINKSFVTSSYTGKESDIIYKIRLKDRREIFIYLLLEFQSTVDKYMALRILRYICELYEFIIKERGDRKFRKLPAVLPVMLYNGDEPWTAVTQFAELVEMSLPEHLIPHIEYIKIAENEYDESELIEIRNAVSALFLTENSGFDNLAEQFGNILKLVNNEDENIAEHFFSWLLNYLKGNDILLDDIAGRIDKLSEGKDMLATSIQKSREYWTQVGRQSGMQQGIQQGMQQGMQKGQVEMAKQDVLEVLELKFPPLPYMVREKIEYCDDLNTLKDLHRQAILADSIDDLKLP